MKLFSLKSLVVILGVVLIGILYFGLGPGGIRLPNGADWLSDQPGIRFNEYGIAFTDPYIEVIPGGDTDANGFTVEIALAPAELDEGGFSFVWVFHNGRDSDQLLMGQWRSHFIVMNADDYNHSRKIKRITANAALRPYEKHFVTITSGSEGSRIYIDGRLAKTKNDLSLKIPVGEKVRLVVGNSPSGKHSWRGDIFGLAIYRHALSDREIDLHFDNWTLNQSFTFAEKDNPFILYYFDENFGPTATDHAGGKRHLHIPPTAKVLQRQFLSPPRGGMDLTKLNGKDIVINLVGFIPFGFILSATLSKLGGMFRKHGVLLAVGACFAVSMVIEVTQAWIPSRSSDLLDLVFNTSGGWIGAIIYPKISGRIGAS